MRRIASSLNKLRDDRSLLCFCCGVASTSAWRPRARQPRRQRLANCRVRLLSRPRARRKSRAARRNRRTRTQRAKTAATRRRVCRASRSCGRVMSLASTAVLLRCLSAAAIDEGFQKDEGRRLQYVGEAPRLPRRRDRDPRPQDDQVYHPVTMRSWQPTKPSRPRFNSIMTP